MSTSSGLQKLDTGWIAGRVPPPIALTLPYNVTGDTIVLELEFPDGTTSDLTGVADYASDSASGVTFTPTADDSVAGYTHARIVRTDANSKVRILGEFQIVVREDF